MLTKTRARHYIIKDDTAYDLHTPIAVISIIEEALKNQFMYVFVLGDRDTGESWGNIIKGRVKRSERPELRTPLVFPAKRNKYGEALLTDCIIAVKQDGKYVYKHPLFK